MTAAIVAGGCSQEQIAAIERLCLEGLGNRPIAKQLGCGVHRVRKYRPAGCLSERQQQFRSQMQERYWYNGRKQPGKTGGREDKLLAALRANNMPMI